MFFQQNIEVQDTPISQFSLLWLPQHTTSTPRSTLGSVGLQGGELRFPQNQEQQPICAPGGWQTCHQGPRVTDLFWWCSCTHHASDRKSKAPEAPTSQNIFPSAILMNSICHFRQGEEEKPGVRCFTFHINRKNSRVLSKKATFLTAKPKAMQLAVLQDSAVAGCEEGRLVCMHSRSSAGKKSYFHATVNHI